MCGYLKVFPRTKSKFKHLDHYKYHKAETKIYKNVKRIATILRIRIEGYPYAARRMKP
jgi:hypothetical protein